MDIVKLNIKDIIPYERNAKKHDKKQIENVMESIRQFGFVQPVVVDSDNVLIIGHCRFMAAKRLEMNEIDAVVAKNLTKEQADKLRLLDNKLNESEWDYDLLLEDIPELDFSGFDIDWGLPEDKASGNNIEEDEPPKLPEQAISRLGDIFEIGGVHRIICGDSTDKAVIELLLDCNKADLIFTDPPYGINIVNDNGKVGAENLAKNRKYSKIIADDTTDTAEAAFYILKEFCNKIILWGGNYFTKFLPFSDGWIIWDKRIDMNSNNFADGEMAWCSFHTPVRIYHQLWNGMIREDEHEDRVHPTQKPVKMLGEVLRDFSKENDIVLDTFGGSGSTLIACEQTNRKCFMCELDPRYVDVILKRYINLKGTDEDIFLIRDGQRIPYKELIQDIEGSEVDS